jgi:hypothetical protein
MVPLLKAFAAVPLSVSVPGPSLVSDVLVFPKAPLIVTALLFTVNMELLLNVGVR